MTSEEWGGSSSWNVLFDRLCHQRGYPENAELASELCRQMGRSGERDFQAAEKNLRDWRLGKRIPLRRNAAVLSRLLDVDSDPFLRRKWDETYHAVHGGEERGRAVDLQEAVLGGDGGRPAGGGALTPRTVLFWSAALPAGILVATGMNGLAVTGNMPADRAGLPTVAYNARAFLSVGTEKLIHGAVEGCGGAPSSWADIVPGLPASKTGIFVDGGLATKMMNGCGEEMVVRAIKFIAIRPGVEELKVLDDYFKIEVTSASAGHDRGL
ncbi:hypothetical protein [Shinella sp. BYT-45]|uniref:hypothetical protein n=1 Tax=Shinella sp. BYT-45 TaxID=3377377 RepID=UPI003980B731